MSTSIDLIYVNFNNYKEIIYSLKSLYEIVDELKKDFFIYIVDNSFSITRSEFIYNFQNKLKEFNNHNKISIKFIPSDRNIGFGKGCNMAAKEGSSEKIIIINPDTSFEKCDPNLFNQFIQVINEEDVISGPKIVDEKGLPKNSCFSFDPISILLKPLRHVKIISKRLKFITKINFFKLRIDRISYKGISKNKLSYVDWLSGCFMLINRNFYDQVNGFDERFFLYFDDVDFCRKARQMGKNVIYNPSFEIIHKGAHQSRSIKGILKSFMNNKTARYHICSWAKYVWKWRMDFIYKLIYKIKGKRSKLEYLSTNYYNLDFSHFVNIEDKARGEKSKE